MNRDTYNSCLLRVSLLVFVVSPHSMYNGWVEQRCIYPAVSGHALFLSPGACAIPRVVNSRSVMKTRIPPPLGKQCQPFENRASCSPKERQGHALLHPTSVV